MRTEYGVRVSYPDKDDVLVPVEGEYPLSQAESLVLWIGIKDSSKATATVVSRQVTDWQVYDGES